MRSKMWVVALTEAHIYKCSWMLTLCGENYENMIGEAIPKLKRAIGEATRMWLLESSKETTREKINVKLNQMNWLSKNI